jgi:hypothetical protein
LYYIGLVALDSALGLDPQIQFKLPINAVNVLVIPAKLFDVTQINKTKTEPPAPVRGSQSQ